MSETDPVTTLVDPDSLQLPHSVSVSLNCVDGFKVHLNQLFNQWLSLSETQKMVTVLLEEAKSGSPLVVSGSSESTDAGASSSPLPNVFPGGSTPPLSPRSFSGSPRSVARRHEPRLSSLRSLPKRSNDSVKEFIPQFYFHNGPPLPADVAEKCLKKLNEIFSAHIDGLHIEDFKPITKEICKLPSFFSTSLFRKLDLDNDGIVTRDQFVSYWIDNKMATVDSLTLVFKLLKHPDQNYLTKEDFIPVLEELVNTHPGLEFLQSTREFQERYESKFLLY